MGRDTGIGLGLLACCGLLYWQAGRVSTPPFVPIGPSFYPRIILILLAGLAVWLIVEASFRKEAPAKEAKKGTGPAPDYRKVCIGFLIFLGYVVALSLLGYLTATLLFVLGLSWMIGPRNVRDLPKLVAVAIGTTLATYLIFEKYLYVFLPRGFLF